MVEFLPAAWKVSLKCGYRNAQRLKSRTNADHQLSCRKGISKRQVSKLLDGHLIHRLTCGGSLAGKSVATLSDRKAPAAYFPLVR